LKIVGKLNRWTELRTENVLLIIIISEVKTKKRTLKEIRSFFLLIQTFPFELIAIRSERDKSKIKDEDDWRSRERSPRSHPY